MMRKVFALLALSGLSACAYATDAVNSDASPAELQISTAKYFETSVRNVSVSDFTADVLGTAYKARVGGQLHNCRYFRSTVSCERAGRQSGYGFGS